MRSLSLLGLLSLLAACRAPEALVSAGEHPPIRTNQSEYVITRSERLLETRLGLTYVNRTGAPVFIHSCGGAEPPLLEKRVGGQCVVALVPVIDLCLGSPITVAPGATYPYEYRLTAGAPGTSTAPQFQVNPVSGIYRMVWSLYSEAPPGSPPTRLLPLRERASNEFRLLEGS